MADCTSWKLLRHAWSVTIIFRQRHTPAFAAFRLGLAHDQFALEQVNVSPAKIPQFRIPQPS